MGTGTRSRRTSGLGRFAGDARKGWARALRRHPSVGIVASIVLAVVGVVLLAVGLLAENLLYFLASALAGLGGVAVRRAGYLERQRQGMKGPKVSRPPGARKPPGEAPPAAPAPPSGPVKCTETGKVTSDCECSSRHVASSEGVATFGKPLGTPYGKRKKPAKAATL